MTITDALGAICAELKRAECKFPTFPVDPVHAAAVVIEEAGELQRAALQFTYESVGYEDLYCEAIHTGAMALRFLCHIELMKKRPSEQVERVTGIAQQAQPKMPLDTMDGN